MQQNAGTIAEQVLSDALGGAVTLGQDEGLGGSDRSNVYRFPVLSGPSGMPRTVVVKQAAGRDNESYDPDAPRGPAWRLFNDWAGLQFLTEVIGGDAPTPRFYGGDREAGLIVLEDFGPGTQLDHLLLGEDRKAAEQGLMGLMTALGTMHALTIGRRSDYEQLRDDLGPREDPERSIHRQRQILQTFADAAGISVPSGIEAEFKFFETFLDSDNPFMAYSHHDPCPDNCLMVGRDMKLLDFEFGGFRHALLDGVYGRIHFPTCWCVNRLPSGMYDEMEKVYQRALAAGCPEAGDDDIFRRTVVEACALQLLNCLYTGMLEEDGQWGIATHRQRVLVRLDRVTEITEARHHLELLGSTTRDLASALRKQWQKDMEEMPLYPAFR